MNTCDFLLDRGMAGDVAVIEGSRRWTYSQLRDAVNTMTSLLRSMELPAGEPVVITGPNTFFWIASYLAVMKTGLVAVPLPPDHRIAERLAWVGAHVVLVERRALRRLALPEYVTTLTEQDLASGLARPGSSADVADTDDAALMLTSGSTAEPKAVRVTHGNLQANTLDIVDYLSLTATDRMLVVLPFHYCFGASLLHTHLFVGGSLVLCNTFAFPETAVDALADNDCTGLAGVPSTYAILLRRSTFGRRELPRLRLIQQAGGHLADSFITQLAAAQPQAEVFIMYGQTEATARLSYLPPRRLADKLGSIGRGLPGVELQVRTDEKTIAGPGETGEIWARGASISPGYRDNPAATAAKFRDGWLHTGDLARTDEEGFIYLVDRKDAFIKSWGNRISAMEVEEVALGLPEVVNAAAVGARDEMAGEVVVLFVEVTDRNADVTHRLRRYLDDHLPRHAVPKDIRVISALPLTANGKVDRPALRDLARCEGTPA